MEENLIDFFSLNINVRQTENEQRWGTLLKKLNHGDTKRKSLAVYHAMYNGGFLQAQVG